MGRRAEFTDEQIIEAGKAISVEGKPVSTFAIRNRLQGGSSERIKSVWSNYVVQQESLIEPEDPEVELPSEIIAILEKNQKTAQAQLEKLTVEGYKVAQQVAEKRVKSTTEDYQSKIGLFEDSENQASIALEASDKKIEELELLIESLTEKNESLISENSKLEGRLNAINEHVIKLEKIEHAYNEIQREYGKLEGKLEALTK